MPKVKSGTGPKPEVSPRERHPAGKPVIEASKGKAPALVKRIMDHAVLIGADRRVATVLGRLRLEGVLTEIEMEAGLRYAEVVGEYERVKGHPRRSAKSPSYDDGFKGAGGLDLDALRKMDPEAADKVETKIKRRIKRIVKKFEACQGCMPGAAEGGRNIVSTVVEEVCCNDQPIHSSYHPILKNVLRRMAETCFRMNVEEEDAPKKAPKVKKGDASLLAEAACDAIAKVFEDEKATIHAFEIGPGKHKTRRIECFGVARDGKTPVIKSIEAKLKGLMPAVLDAQLVKSAIAHGWADASRRHSGEPNPKLNKPTLHLGGGA